MRALIKRTRSDLQSKGVKLSKLQELIKILEYEANKQIEIREVLILTLLIIYGIICLISHCSWYSSQYACFAFSNTIWPLSHIFIQLFSSHCTESLLYSILTIPDGQVYRVEVQENSELPTDNVSSPWDLLLRHL